ncbi:MAG TPA: cell surface protein SprA, partial [Phnomibacter sp.]|nr:cell surface protein SprA [Phnomibacter sp.]
MTITQRRFSFFFGLLLLHLVLSELALAGPRRFLPPDNDTTRRDSLRYPISDRRGDRYSNGRQHTFDLKDTGYLKQQVEYDPVTKQYYITEKIGDTYYRKPTFLTFDEYMRMRARDMERENFQKRSEASFALNRKLVRPSLRIYDDLFNRIFGNGKIDIRPNGNVDIMAGYQGQNVKNPTLPERARKYGTFDFDMNAQFNMNANIGDKMKLPINFNTLANFDFENQLKLDYKSSGDEIIRSIEAGNMSFATKGRLIQGAQALFGIKTELQFGRLTLTGVLANQKSQRQTQNFQGGASVVQFDKKLDDYEENRHFLLAQYFRDQYNTVMSTLPFVQSQVQIMRLEVWVTNRTGQTTDSRDVVALMDLGERQPFNQNIPVIPGGPLPDNGSNGLYGIVNNEAFRNPNAVTTQLQARGLRPVQDFERTFARKLREGTDYIFNKQVGFVSINQFIQPDEVLGVAFQYTLNGRVFQVGEFAQDISLDTAQQGVQKVLFLKMLKATSQRPRLPIWNLMMKNVYSLDLYNVERDGFRINLTYEEPGGGEKRMLPEGDEPGRPLLRIVQLDRLNNRNDPQPDGVFDYVDSFTIQPQYGRIIFPLLEPFGSDLKRLAFANQPDDVANKYVFQALYDTIKMIAQQNYANVNRYYLRGQAKSSQQEEVYLNAINVPPGSVTVMAGGQVLRENVDYVIDYNLGKLTVINQAIKNSGVPVSVNLENNVGFGIQNRGFMALRADYLANKNLSIGATMMQLGERPFFTKMNYGEDPIRNKMYGVDFNYQSEWKQLTRWLNKIPSFSSNAPSSIQAYGEAAMLRPGQPPQIGKGQEALIYLDDFEGTRANIDLRFPFIGWAHASTPQGAGFAEADAINNLINGQNRARLAWYQIEPVMQDARNPNNPIKDRNLLSDPRVRSISNQELFPQSTPPPGFNQLISFDMAYYPRERGVYNFDTRPGSILPDGKLSDPKSRWGGIMRAIDQTDFETANIEFVEFWLQDPFLRNAQFPNGYTNPAGGELYINLGNVSEDILRDGRRFYENGLPSPSQPNLAVDTSTVWGKAPINPIQIANAFSNNPEDRPFQDVGFDGLNDDEERAKRITDFLNPLQNVLPPGSPALAEAQNDPSNDNFVNYRNTAYDAINAGILTRYKKFNGPQGNSPVSGESTTL